MSRAKPEWGRGCMEPTCQQKKEKHAVLLPSSHQRAIRSTLQVRRQRRSNQKKQQGQVVHFLVESGSRRCITVQVGPRVVRAANGLTRIVPLHFLFFFFFGPFVSQHKMTGNSTGLSCLCRLPLPLGETAWATVERRRRPPPRHVNMPQTR